MKRTLLFSVFLIVAFFFGYLSGESQSHKIARIWHGVTPESQKDTYLQYLREQGLPHLTGTKGNLGAYILRRVQNGQAEFLVISLWDSFDSMKGYAGANVNNAVILPKDKEFLMQVEPSVNNYEIMTEDLKQD